MLKLGSSLVKGGASLLTFVKDNLKLYLDFNSNKSDTLKFPSEGSTFFNGSSDYITVSDSNSLSIAGSVTFSAWVKPTDLNSTITILSKTHTSNLGFNFQIASNDTFYFRINDGSNNYSVYSTATLTLGKWHHLCVSWNQNDGRAKFYLDGVESGRSSNSAVTGMGSPDNTVDLTIGRRSDGFSAEYYKGKLSNVAMWSRDLSQEEVQSIMNKSYSQLKGVEKTSLVSWWGLDNDTAMQSNVSTFLDNTTGADGTWDNSGGVMTISSDRYRYFNHFIPSAVSDTSKKMKFTITAKKTGSGSVSLWFKGNTIDTFPLTNNYQTFTINMYNQTVGDNFVKFTGASGSNQVIVTKFDAQYYGSYDSHGSNNGNNNYVAPVFTESLSSDGLTYGSISQLGGNAPILPRAVDVAKEGQAEKIGNGSASFNSTSDYIDIGSDSLLDDIWAGGGTFTGWININSAGENDGGMFIVKRGSDSGGYISTKDPSGNTCKLRLAARWDNWAQWTTTSRDLTYNEWIHIAVSYDNGSTSNNPTMYINGVSVAVTTVTTPTGTYESNASDDLYIGGEAGAFTTDGSISQVGLWRGELTQAQIQSVMESTSYSKIPADVKSTKSTLVTDGGWTIGGSWVYDSSTGYYTNTYVNGTDTPIGNIIASPTTTQGNLYKLSYTVVSTTGSPTLKFPNNMLGLSSSDIPYTVGETNVHYGVDDGSSENIGLRSNTGVGTIVLKDIKFEEITNDLVAYYPLDGSSSANGVTQDVTTGEVLGSEILTTNVDTDWTAYGSNDVDNVTDGVKITHDDNAGGAARTIAGSSGKLYKVVFNAYYSGGTAPNVKVWTGAINSGTQALTTSSTQYIIYFVNAGTSSLYFDSVNGSQEIFITNLSAKEVTSNTGVLK